MPFEPGQRIRLSEDAEMRLAGACAEVIDQLESDNRDRFERDRVAWDQYDARPKHKVRTTPWRRASNVVMPVVSTQADAVTARLQGAIHTPKRTWMVRSGNERNLAMVPSLDEFMNRESRTTFNLPMATNDWIHEAVVCGGSVLGVGWNSVYTYRWNRMTRKPQAVLVQRGPVVEHISREFMLWERDRTIAQSGVVVRSHPMSWSDIVNSAPHYEWNIEGLDSYQGLTGPGAEVVQHRRRLEGVADVGEVEPHDVRELWLEYDMAALMAGQPFEIDEGTNTRAPIAVHYHRKAQRVLRVVAHPYYFWRWPFLDLYYKKISGRGAGKGTAAMIGAIQNVISTMYNQSIDAVTLSNTLKFVTSDSKLKNQVFSPFVPIYVENMADFRELNLTSQILPDVQLINMGMAFAERRTGVADSNLGREVRLGGHPSPATNTLVHLQEGNKSFKIMLDQIRSQLSTLGEWVLMLYQQNEDPSNPRLTRSLGEEDAAYLREVLVTPDEFEFDLVSLDEMNNPDAERNRAILTVQATQNYAAFALRMASLIENPQVGPLTKQVARLSMEAMSKLQQQVLEAMDVDDARELVLRMEEMENAVRDNLSAVGGALGAPGGAPGLGAGPVRGAPVGNGGVPIPGAEAGAIGAPGSGFLLG